MLFSVENIKYRAVVMGVKTGQMPDVGFIWAVQKDQGDPVCFGQGVDCQQLDCRWRGECRALDSYENVTLPSWERRRAEGN